MPILESITGLFSGFPIELLLFTLAICLLGFTGAPLWLWLIFAAAALGYAGAPVWLWVVFGVLALSLNIPPLRRTLISAPVMKLLNRLHLLPAISHTERTAIEAGTVWVEADLFSGRPNFKRLNSEPYPGLTDEEQAFLDGPVEEVCRRVKDWEVYVHKDLPQQVWDYLKEKRFYGLIIPKAYGGLGFSASAHSAVVGKLASRSMPLCVTVMVPNSLGPAELLIHYGTEDQKDTYLPRLARGEEIPCFALTEPDAGSDAGSIRSSGTVFKGEDGRLYLRLNWKKRYITLASISTLLGLAFQLEDPDNLLGKGKNPGITCALVPADTPGVILGLRHDPMGVPFYNAPTEGVNVILPVDAIVGGPAGAGQGWHMLMETLAAGRGISLPATSTFATKFVARVAGAHAAVRKQFGLSIGRFEGIQEPLARIGGFAYLMEAARRYTCGALDRGAKPAVVTAIAKYNFTELYRKAINDGMDILAGNAISRGPRNLLAHNYIWAPINITVEGANILTLIIFGQGAIRCHPYLYDEIRALAAGDARAFDRAFWAHVGHVVQNAFRATLLSLTRGTLASSLLPGPAARYCRKLAWASASFALLSDLALCALGGGLKRKEKITGRFADIFSWIYLGIAVLRRFEAEGRRKQDLPFLHWSMQYALSQIQTGFDGLFQNLAVPGLGWLLRGPIALWSRLNPLSAPPSDRLGSQIAQALQTPGPERDALTGGIYLPFDPDKALGRLERAFRLSCSAEAVSRKVKDAVRSHKLPAAPPEALITKALNAGILTPDEAALPREAESARNDAIQVDQFTLKDYMSATPTPPHETGPKGIED